MTGHRFRFVSLVDYDGENVSFGDNSKAQIIGKGCLGGDQKPTLNDVFLVDGLKQSLLSTSQLCDKGNQLFLVDGIKHNLLSISQLCDKGNQVIFDSNSCKVLNAKTNKVILPGLRNNDNIYTIEECSENESRCLMTKDQETQLWHQRMGHVNFKLIKMLSKQKEH